MDLTALVDRTAALLLLSGIRNLDDQIQVVADKAVIQRGRRLRLLGRSELNVAEPTVGVVLERRESDINDLATL